MRVSMRVVLLLLISAFTAMAQVPVPQINLTGNIGCQGFPCVNSGTLVFANDADYYMTAQDTSAFYLKVTSSVTLTATRNLVAPAGRFPFTIENSTTGGQAIQIIGPSGAGVTIANDQITAVWNDGTNFVQVGAAGTGTVTGVTGTAPVESTGGTAPVIWMHVADASNNGYLSSTNWSTFNGKQTALTNPVTGLSGGCTIGHVVTSANTSCTNITDGGVPPMVYPGEGVVRSTGSAWGASYSTTGSGSYLLLTDGNIQISMPTGAISANSCTSPTSIADPSVVSTSAFATAFASNPNAVTGWGASGGLVFTIWPTSGHINWSVCNQSSASITGGAMTINVGVQ
jgi:hypothetical protein